ncbi:virulence factor BrkB family protein [Vibrio stylophorae]
MPFFYNLNGFGHHLWARAVHDRMTVTAGYLAYVTLLSLVPMVTVTFSALARFPEFADTGVKLQQFVINNFVPTAGDTLQTYLNEFVANAGRMTTIGLGALFVIAIMLISNIDSSLNYIWRVKQKRRLVVSFSVYWMVLTLGPLMMGASLAVSSYVLSLSILHDSETLHSIWPTLLRFFPVMVSSLAIWGLYMIVPNTQVKIRHAAVGALIAALLFEATKKIFALYLTHFPSYQVIYGALAIVPILFVWVYLCWILVLLGAEITVSLAEGEQWRYDRRQGPMALRFGAQARAVSSATNHANSDVVVGPKTGQTKEIDS